VTSVGRSKPRPYGAVTSNRRVHIVIPILPTPEGRGTFTKTPLDMEAHSQRNVRSTVPSPRRERAQGEGVVA
jgi:hypothetical protein